MKIINRIIDAVLICALGMAAGMIFFSAVGADIGRGSVVGFLFGVVLVVGWLLGKSGEES